MDDLQLQLLDEGYCVIPNVLSSNFVDRLREATDITIDAMAHDHRQAQQSTGSMVPIYKCETCGELVGHCDMRKALEGLGFSDWRYTSGYIISKPPDSPPLFWHYDWGGWSHPFSYERMPTQVFVMAYLVDTNPGNGCLRVIPRSHIEDHPLHEMMRDAHTEELLSASDLSAVEFQKHSDDVDVAVQAGDLVVGDARLIHGAHANNSDRRRTVVTMWFFPNYGTLPEPIQGYVARRFQDEPDDVATWDPRIRKRLYDLRPFYHGNRDPVPFSRERLSRKAFFAKRM